MLPGGDDDKREEEEADFHSPFQFQWFGSNEDASDGYAVMKSKE